MGSWGQELGCRSGAEGTGNGEQARRLSPGLLRGGRSAVEAGWALGSGLVALAVVVSRSPAACGERCEGKGQHSVTALNGAERGKEQVSTTWMELRGRRGSGSVWSQRPQQLFPPLRSQAGLRQS